MRISIFSKEMQKERTVLPRHDISSVMHHEKPKK